MAATLNAAQTTALAARMEAVGATSYVADRDEPYDEHAFVVMYRDRAEVGEVVIEGDGTFAGEEEEG